MTIVSSGGRRYNARTMTSVRRVTGLLVAACLASGMGRAPAASVPSGAAVPVRLVVDVANIDDAPHPIRITVDGQPVFRRVVRGPSHANWPFFGARRGAATVRLTVGAHQLALEEEQTHIVQQASLAVTRACEVRVQFWPWYQDGRFRQEPHFTVTVRPPSSGRVS